MEWPRTGVETGYTGYRTFVYASVNGVHTTACIKSSLLPLYSAPADLHRWLSHPRLLS